MVAMAPVMAPSMGMATAAPATPVTANAPAATANHVTIAGFAYSPSTLTVTKGTTVTWTNNDSAPHTVTGSGGLNSPTLSRGGTYSFKFNSAGTFNYICTIHPYMHGTVVVK
ncbi:cupredoxin domain-containing protein [Streptomyces sp. NPDC002536]